LADTELLPSSSEPSTGIRRKGRGAFTDGETGAFDLAPLVPVSKEGEWNLAEGVDPNARVGVRFGLEGDMELRGSAKGSDWYRRNGRHAGKEVATGRRSLGDEREEGLSWKGASGSGEGRDFAKRLGRAVGPYERREGRGDGRRGGKGKTMEDLDKELEGIRAGPKEGDEDVDMESSGRNGGRRRGRGKAEDRGKDDLDKGQFVVLCVSDDVLTWSSAELDDMFASRTTSTI